jgi:hypothetical protein
MPRSFGRILSSIWDDEDFRDLTPNARLVYIFLFSQPDLDHAGVIPLRKPRWVRALAMQDHEVDEALSGLAKALYVVIDEIEGELLVRSLIRRDDIWRQPNVFKAASSAAMAAKSHAIKAALLGEIQRLDLSSTSKETQRIRDDLVTHLEPFANPSPTPPDAPFIPPGNGRRAPDSDTTDTVRESAGQNPSGTLREPVGNHSVGGPGKGNGYGPVLQVSPFPNPNPPSPQRASAGEAMRPLWPSVVPDAKPGEEGEDQQSPETRDVPALVTSLRKIRPDWTTASIERAVTDPRCAERPWDLVWEAAHILAADDKTDQPGRLPCDGPWWAEAARRLRAQRGARPGWCGDCDERTRMLGMDGDHPRPCPVCKPKARAS